MRHLVDLEPSEHPVWKRDGDDFRLVGYKKEPYVCTCEAYEMHGHRPCPHVLDALDFILPELKAIWPEHWTKKLFDLIEDQKTIKKPYVIR